MIRGGLLCSGMGTVDLNHLSVFAAVAEAASFTEAARRLGIPKSTVSRAVTTLEASLGVRVLERSTRHVALTSAGRALLDRLGPRLDALAEAMKGLPELADEPSGALRVTTTADFGTEILAGIIAGFCRRYPRVSVFVREALRQGAGIGFLATFLAQQDVLAGRLVPVLPRWAMPTGHIYLVYPSNRHLPKKMVVFRDHVIAAIRARPLPAGER